MGDRSKSYIKLALRLSQHTINHLCIDAYEVYNYIDIAKYHHTTKAETTLVESKNSLIRNYLARFNRRTKRYSKSIDMITIS